MAEFYGDASKGVDRRKASYDMLRTFIFSNHDWKKGAPPDSDILGPGMQEILGRMTKEEFAFLLCHTGFIPEEFEPDSSEETIYTKMVEVVVGEWARRIGFTDTVLPKQKSSTEDITVTDGKYLIVCDAKSFRLGRSQKAPNVKDALKEGDIPKWLKNHSEKNLTQLGGLVTFPSQHDWSGGSDFYLYLTNKELPIVCLFYEHMAFTILYGIDKAKLVCLYSNYPSLFPTQLKKTDGNRAKYWAAIEKHLFEGNEAKWNGFRAIAQQVIGEKIHHTVKSVEAHLSAIRNMVREGIPKDATLEELREMLVEAKADRETFVVAKQLANIMSFRDHLGDYLTE
jgi:hypothetical protein